MKTDGVRFRYMQLEQVIKLSALLFALLEYLS